MCILISNETRMELLEVDIDRVKYFYYLIIYGL